MEIVLKRAEGNIEECITVKVESFEASDIILNYMARTAPISGGYDKTDFLVTFNDGETYKGRFDLKESHKDKRNLITTQIKNVLSWELKQAIREQSNLVEQIIADKISLEDAKAPMQAIIERSTYVMKIQGLLEDGGYM